MTKSTERQVDVARKLVDDLLEKLLLITPHDSSTLHHSFNYVLRIRQIVYPHGKPTVMVSIGKHNKQKYGPVNWILSFNKNGDKHRSYCGKGTLEKAILGLQEMLDKQVKIIDPAKELAQGVLLGRSDSNIATVSFDSDGANMFMVRVYPHTPAGGLCYELGMFRGAMSKPTASVSIMFDKSFVEMRSVFAVGEPEKIYQIMEKAVQELREGKLIVTEKVTHHAKQPE